MKDAVMLLVASLLLLSGHASADEVLAWDLNKVVTKVDQGFPWDWSPPNNFDWTAPVDYAGGTIYYRYIIRSCAGTGQDVCMQFCFHQNGVENEGCGEGMTFKTFVTGFVVIEKWSQRLSTWWMKPGAPLDWSQPRSRAMVAIKKGTNTGGTPISDICCGWNWADLDPDQIYPIDMRFTGVVVSAGGTFSGWASYPDDDDPVAVQKESAGIAASPAPAVRVRGRRLEFWPPTTGEWQLRVHAVDGRSAFCRRLGRRGPTPGVELRAAGTFMVQVFDAATGVSSSRLVVVP
jgi:hypothetical protein